MVEPGKHRWAIGLLLNLGGHSNAYHIALKAGRLVVGNVGRREAAGGGGGAVAGGEEGFSSGQASAGAEPVFTVLP